jgi:hypothetical protein
MLPSACAGRTRVCLAQAIFSLQYINTAIHLFVAEDAAGIGLLSEVDPEAIPVPSHEKLYTIHVSGPHFFHTYQLRSSQERTKRIS